MKTLIITAVVIAIVIAATIPRYRTDIELWCYGTGPTPAGVIIWRWIIVVLVAVALASSLFNWP